MALARLAIRVQMKIRLQMKAVQKRLHSALVGLSVEHVHKIVIAVSRLLAINAPALRKATPQIRRMANALSAMSILIARSDRLDMRSAPIINVFLAKIRAA